MPIDIKALLQQVEKGQGNTLPPIEKWHPTIEGEIDIVIDNNMHWHHEGTAFTRLKLMKLLAGLLRKEGEDYFLVTPTEKMRITVSDVPFEIIALAFAPESNAVATLITNTEDIIKLEHEDQWQLRQYDNTLIPYVKVRDELWARVNRAVFYQMVNLAKQDSEHFYFTSNNQSFALN